MGPIHIPIAKSCSVQKALCPSVLQSFIFLGFLKGEEGAGLTSAPKMIGRSILFLTSYMVLSSVLHPGDKYWEKGPFPAPPWYCRNAEGKCG